MQKGKEKERERERERERESEFLVKAEIFYTELKNETKYSS